MYGDSEDRDIETLDPYHLPEVEGRYPGELASRHFEEEVAQRWVEGWRLANVTTIDKETSVLVWERRLDTETRAILERLDDVASVVQYIEEAVDRVEVTLTDD